MPSPPHATEIAIHRVLSAIDFSPSSVRALNHAIEIARSYGAKYHLAQVVSSTSPTRDVTEAPIFPSSPALF